MRNLDLLRFVFNPIQQSRHQKSAFCSLQSVPPLGSNSAISIYPNSSLTNRAAAWTLLVVALGLTGAAEAGVENRHNEQFDRIEAATCAAPLRAVRPHRLLNIWRIDSTQLFDVDDNPIRQTLVTIPIRAKSETATSNRPSTKGAGSRRQISRHRRCQGIFDDAMKV